MSKRTRFIIVLVVIVGCLGFLYPTVNWYFLRPQWETDLSESSNTWYVVELLICLESN